MPKAALKKLGPSLTAQLASHLCQEHRISADTARKRIQRATENGEVKILKAVNFAHNQSFAYLPEHYGTKFYHERLFEAMTEAKSALRLPLAALRARGGSIPDRLFPTISGCPISSEFKQDSQKLKQKLLDLGFIVQDADYIHLATVKGRDRLTQAQIQATLHAENSLLTTLADWLQRQRFIGNQMSFRFSDELPQSGYHQWDFVAPSYIAPLATRTKQKATPGFVVADVILGRAINQYEVQYFLEKCSNIRVHQKNRPFLAFLVADWFDQEALNLAQANGVIFTTPKNLFGSKFAEALEEFRKILEEKDNRLEEQAAQYSALLARIQNLAFVDKLNDNLRGQLFEVIVGHCFAKMNVGTVQLGKPFKDPTEAKYWDCDVLQTSESMSLRACECKGYRGQTKVTLDDAKKWFRKIVPIIRDYFNVSDYPDQEFSIWTSGEFEDDALKWIKELAANCKKFKVAYKSRDELSQIIEKVGDPTIKDAYNRWFKPVAPKKESAA